MADMMNVNDAWQMFTAPNGENYFYNWVTHENTWDKPQALIDKEARLFVSNDFSGVSEKAIQPLIGIAGSQSVGYAGFQTSIAGATPVEFSSSASSVQTVNKDVKCKPISSNAIADSPWCVVWTNDNKVFFYNPSIKTSVWERPPELYNRADVDVLVTKPPDKDFEESKKAAEAGKQSEENQAHDESDEESTDKEEEYDGESAAKRMRKEKKIDHQVKEQTAKKKPVPSTEKPVDLIAQAELRAQEDRNKIPLELRIKKFRELLEEKNIVGSSVWEKELSKLVFDERYLLLCAAERKAVFQAFAKERSEIERAERKKKAKEARQDFKNLLSEADLHGKSSFISFTKKYGKDSRFTALERSRDREEYFRDFTSELYKQEKKAKKKLDQRKRDQKKDSSPRLKDSQQMDGKNKEGESEDKQSQYESLDQHVETPEVEKPQDEIERKNFRC